MEELFELAVAASQDVQSPWRPTGNNEVRGASGVCVASAIRTDALTKYLAAVDPETVAALLTKLEALQRTVSEIVDLDVSALNVLTIRRKLREALRESQDGKC